MRLAIYSGDNYNSLDDAIGCDAVYETPDFGYSYQEFKGVLNGLDLAVECSFHNNDHYQKFIVLNGKYYELESFYIVIDEHGYDLDECELIELLNSNKE